MRDILRTATWIFAEPALIEIASKFSSKAALDQEKRPGIRRERCVTCQEEVVVPFITGERRHQAALGILFWSRIEVGSAKIMGGKKAG